MNAWLENMTVQYKLRGIAALGIVGLLLLGGWQVWASYERGFTVRKEATRAQVETAMGVIKWAHALEATGKLDRQSAQQQARAAVSTLRYNGSEYFWINDMHPRVVMHPIKPELDGKDVTDTKDPQGKSLFVAFADMVRKEGKGFVYYLWPKPGQAEPVPKVSYVQGFEPWGWVLGSGIYIDDLKAELWAQVRALGAVVLVLAVVMVVLSQVIGRSIVQRLSMARRAADELSKGNLGYPLASQGHDDVGLLMRSLHHMAQQLRAMVGTIQGTADHVENAAGAIANGNADLSMRTEQQSSSLQQTASSMEELSATVKQNADNAAQANQLAMGASSVAIEGGEVVSRVVETMKGITESSRRIADIIAVIDGIAFQTNILALNAAVEAARAGEQGRGFAVVAGEVRTLAQRSAEAAKEIKNLIGASVERVEQGTSLVDQAGNTMNDVVAAIKRVTDIVGEITAASAEQSTGVAQVGQAVSQMDQATQQNAALVGKSATAAQELRGQAQQLVHAVAAFKL
jgi:methyl-accepting chemotaxis protein